MDAELLRIVESVLGAGETVQGLVCPEILLPEGACSGDDPALVHDVVDFTNWALTDAALFPGEFPLEALCSYHVDFYAAQVLNGGHDQWAANSGWEPLIVRATEVGLEAIGASAHLQILREYLAYMSDPSVAEAVLERGGFDLVDDRSEALDDRFYELDEHVLTALNAAWLRERPMSRELDPEGLQARKSEIVAANSLRAERLERGAGRAEDQAEEGRPAWMDADNALIRTVRAACAAAGLECRGLSGGFQLPLRLYSPRLPDEMVLSWGVYTDHPSGMTCSLVFRERRRLFGKALVAEFYAFQQEEPLAVIDLTSAEYDEIVGGRG